MQRQTISSRSTTRHRGNGTNAEYHIVGYAGFKVLGYKLVGYEWGNISRPPWNRQGSNYVCPDTTGNSATCLYGEFTEVTTTDGQIGGGSQPDYGARTISMIG